jgi:hypothetical protein
LEFKRKALLSPEVIDAVQAMAAGLKVWPPVGQEVMRLVFLAVPPVMHLVTIYIAVQSLWSRSCPSLELPISRGANRSSSGKLTESSFSPSAAALLNLTKSTARQLTVLQYAFPPQKHEAVKESLTITAKENEDNQAFQDECQAMLEDAEYMNMVVEYVRITLLFGRMNSTSLYF